MDITTKIGEVMTTAVLFVRPNDTMDKVRDIFNVKSIHHLPVVEEGGTVVGIVSKTDCYKLENTFTLFKKSKVEEYNSAIFRSLLVKEVMTKQVATLGPSDSLQLAAGIFRENLFHAMPIVDDEKKLVGILSVYDLVNYAYQEPMLLDDE